MERIYIVKEGEISYDDEYYYFNRHDNYGNICDVYCFIDSALNAAKACAESLYNQYSNQLDEIQWEQYSYNEEDEKRISTTEGKLGLLKELCYSLITIEVYEKPVLWNGKLEFSKSMPITIDNNN